MSTIAKSNAFRETQSGVGDTGATVTLTFETVPAGMWRRYDIVSVINADNTLDKARLYMTGHGYNHLIDEHNTLTANVLYWSPWSFTLVEGETLKMDLTGSTDDDAIDAYVIGVEGFLGDM